MKLERWLQSQENWPKGREQFFKDEINNYIFLADFALIPTCTRQLVIKCSTILDKKCFKNFALSYPQNTYPADLVLLSAPFLTPSSSMLISRGQKRSGPRLRLSKIVAHWVALLALGYQKALLLCPDVTGQLIGCSSLLIIGCSFRSTLQKPIMWHTV